MRPHWRHLANTIEVVLPSAHPSPQPKRQVDRFSRFCTAHGRNVPIPYNGRPFPPKVPLPVGQSEPPSNTRFFGPFRAHNPNGIPIGSAVFAQVTTECPYTVQWNDHFPSKLPLLMEDLNPNLMHGTLGQSRSSTQTASRSV